MFYEVIIFVFAILTL